MLVHGHVKIAGKDLTEASGYWDPIDKAASVVVRVGNRLVLSQPGGCRTAAEERGLDPGAVPSAARERFDLVAAAQSGIAIVLGRDRDFERRSAPARLDAGAREVFFTSLWLSARGPLAVGAALAAALDDQRRLPS